MRMIQTRAADARRAAFLLLMVLAAIIPGSPGLLSAQDVRTVRGSAMDLAPGVVAGEATRQSTAGGVYLRTLRADLGGMDHTIPHARFTVVTAPGGVRATAPLGEVVDARGAHGGIVLLGPGDGDEVALPGILLADGILHAWPATGPLVVGNPEGTISHRALPDSGSARLLLDGRASGVPLDGINGAPGDGATLVGGPVDPNGPVAAAWPEGTEALVLAPGFANRAPGAAVWNAALPTAAREWTVRDRQPLRNLRLRGGEWALVLPPTVAEEERNALADARSLVIQVDLPPDLSLAAFVFPARGTIDPETDAAPPEQVRSLVALDTRGNRAVLAESGGVARGEFAFEVDQLAGLLAREGVTELVELHGSPGRALRLLVRRPDRRPSRAAETARGRAFLLLSPGHPRLPTGDGGNLDRLAISYVAGSNDRQIANTSLALFDGVSGVREEMDHFWSAPLPEGHAATRPTLPGAPRPALQWVEWRLLERADVRALDLIHAQDAGFSPAFNLRSFRILARFDNRSEWVVLAEVHHDAPVPRERVALDAGRPIESLRLEVLEPNFLPGGETARLVEIIPWGR